MLRNKSYIRISAVAVVCSLFAFSACKKTIEPTDNSASLKEKIVSGIARAASEYRLNEEGQRILEDASSFDYEVSIVDNPNYGNFSSAPEHDIYLGGKSEPNLSITIDGNHYKPQANGQWWEQGMQFKNYYGKTVNVEIKDGISSQVYHLSIPMAIKAQKLGSPSSTEISRTGNTLTWKSDPQFNLSGKVLLYYRLYDNDDYCNSDGNYHTDAILLDDNGSYNIDNLISSAQAKRINFILVRGNTATFMSNGKKVLFTIRCSDSHEYVIH